MSKTVKSTSTATRLPARGSTTSRTEDPRVTRTRAAVTTAARRLFLRQGYVGTTMDEIALEAGLTKRTLYNNYADKETLFIGIVREVATFAEAYARELPDALVQGTTSRNVDTVLQNTAERLALAIVRIEVVTLRRLLIGEARTFPALAKEYFQRAPGRVIEALAGAFDRLGEDGVLRVGQRHDTDARSVATQFAYLIAGAPLDRAMLTGTIPTREEILSGAREGVHTFLARYRASNSGKRSVRRGNRATKTRRHG